MGLFVDALSGQLLLLEGGVVPEAITAHRVVTRKVFETDISALKLVRDVSKTTVKLADSTEDYEDAAVTGITLTATEAGNTGLVLSSGYYEDAAFMFPVGAVLALGESGAITTELLPNSTHQTIIGKGTGVGGIFVAIEQPFVL